MTETMLTTMFLILVTCVLIRGAYVLVKGIVETVYPDERYKRHCMDRIGFYPSSNTYKEHCWHYIRKIEELQGDYKVPAKDFEEGYQYAVNVWNGVVYVRRGDYGDHYYEPLGTISGKPLPHNIRVRIK